MRPILLLLLLACLGARVSAAEIYRCEDSAGRQVFTDRPCRAIGALPLPSARDLPPPSADTAAVAGGAAEEPDLSPPPAASGCPGPTPTLLGEALATAAGRGDLNAIAGMYHWPAAGRGAASRVFAEARRLSSAAPLSFEVLPSRQDDSWLWSGEPPPDRPRSLPPELLVSVGRSSDRPIARYALVAHAGCYWLPP
ncbi:DUF4124 domain-containing protein [Pseudomarimonas salicorniae]|uniref:DUF4124 domain-containing protein n=1 Tax=Pseudomarimonas salicorniae TaxID=2933270 RepID=A0ABT0GGD8_9GAMM|nr:DUF4124 domain-containing protein [Lysobacter sp. CAU 1642]MCK7593602.1 DUF4124 domain-containing protein [Lysobacter sp. CAU 1642]